MDIKSFRFALNHLQPSDWEHFEVLASAFLAPEYPNLRTMASPSGDGGRDSELFSYEGNPNIAFQYSIQKDWNSKINATIKRLSEKFPDIKILIYLTNIQIGALADGIRKEFQDKGYMLDIRDFNWFIERTNIDEARRNAADALIDSIAIPVLSSDKYLDKKSSPLTTQETKAALLYLDLQWKDDISDKGLTKLAFDALVRLALRNTHSENRLPRKQIHDAVQSFLPSAPPEIIVEKTDSALKRLTKRYIRHWQQIDEYCLTYDEHLRIISRLADRETNEAEFIFEVSDICDKCLEDIKETSENDRQDLIIRVPRVIETLFLRRGENFVSVVKRDAIERLNVNSIIDIILNDISDNKPPTTNIIHELPMLVFEIIRRLLDCHSDETHLYLKRLSDSYTLLSFLNETPDVQSATQKLFTHGAVWLDTSVLLPVFAETLEDDDRHCKYTKLFKTLVEAGMKFHVTTGIIQEINSHIYKSLMCSQYLSGSWKGRIPYLYHKYISIGNNKTEFKEWVENFRGNERPEDDITFYLSEFLGIQKVDLIEEAKQVDETLRTSLEKHWTEAHRERRAEGDDEVDESVTNQLIQHDLETYLGVIHLRQQESVTELGYRHWLLTNDSVAWKIRNILRREFKDKTPPSPLLSMEFLINNISFGPNRKIISREQELRLPLFLDIELTESMPIDIINIAEETRKEHEGKPEYIIKRKVRDAIDRYRRRRDSFAASKFENMRRTD